MRRTGGVCLREGSPGDPPHLVSFNDGWGDALAEVDHIFPRTVVFLQALLFCALPSHARAEANFCLNGRERFGLVSLLRSNPVLPDEGGGLSSVSVLSAASSF